MKRSDAAADTTPPTHRHALIVHHDPVLLADPDVLAFLDDKPIDAIDADSLQRKFVNSNEPALLVELIRCAHVTNVDLTVDITNQAGLHSLHAGFLDHVLQHLGGMPGVTQLTVNGADLTVQSCALLQATLQDPGCTLIILTLSHCCFASAAVRFPAHAATVKKFDWDEGFTKPAAATDLTQLLPSLATWTNLQHLHLLCGRPPVNFAVLTQLLQANPSIKGMHITSFCVPNPAGHPAPAPQFNPGLMLDAIKHNRTALTRLGLWILDMNDQSFNDPLLRLIGDCMTVNTTLQSLNLPGIKMCTGTALRQFTQDLVQNHTLIKMTPHDPFGQMAPLPVQRNEAWFFMFSPEFVIGAAQAFMQVMGMPRDIGTRVGSFLASTSIDRIYCGPVMALLCKATHAGGVELRSACLRDSLISHIRLGDETTCRNLIATLAKVHIELLPADKAAVVQVAAQLNASNCLPAAFNN